MKKLLAVLCLLPIGVLAQKDPCKGITKEVKELEGKTTYHSPFAFSLYQIVLFKVIKENETAFFAYLTANGSTASYGQKGVYIKFEDGTILKHETMDVDSEYSSGSYSYTAIIPITEDNIELFKTKKIVKYQLLSKEVNVTDKLATNLMAYITCMETQN